MEHDPARTNRTEDGSYMLIRYLGRCTLDHPLSSRALIRPPVLCADPDQFGGMLPGVTRRHLPITRELSFFQLVLQIGDIRLAVVKRPPCASQASLTKGQIGIALPMSDSLGLKLNGLRADRPLLFTHGLTIPHRIFQPSELTIGAVFIPAERSDREWPALTQAARIDYVQPVALKHLRLMIRDVLDLASGDPQLFSQDDAQLGMQESLLGAIDHAFITAQLENQTCLATGRYVKICNMADELIRSHTTKPPSRGEVAAAVGVTTRTLHNAMVSVNGMSPLKFITLNRLWATRAALLQADPASLIKTIALDHGFWHVGRFSQAYRSLFGELPSVTLASSAQHGIRPEN
jgi:AraC-like DNA-binding protein